MERIMDRSKKIKTVFFISIFFLTLMTFLLSASAEEKETASEAVSSQNIEQEVVKTETGF